MPWCTGCDRFLSPSTVTPEGECPRCGARVDPGRAREPAPGPAAGPTEGAGAASRGASRAEATTGAGTEDETPVPLPWHFKLLVGAIALYLGWRAFQGIEWLVRQL